jgi:hypothetical protein
MKKTIINMMFTTGISIVGLTLYFVFIREERILVQTILQLFGANILLHLGLYIRDKFEIRNPLIESVVDNSIIITVLLVFGFVFGWFVKIPVWLLVISAIGLYAITVFITSSEVKKDIEKVNKLLEEQNKEY